MEISGGQEKLCHASDKMDVLSKGKVVCRGHQADQEGEYKRGKLTLGCKKDLLLGSKVLDSL